MIDAIVNKIIDCSFVDGPGNRTVIFLQGCNFNCSYCHNPETIHKCTNCGQCILSCPTQALSKVSGKVMWNKDTCAHCDNCIRCCRHCASPKVSVLTTDELCRRISPNIAFLKGITISGGECTLNRDFIVEFAKKVKTMGLTVLLDTNGSYDFSKDMELINLIDGFMVDIKCFDKDQHLNITTCLNDIVIKNALFLAKTSNLVEIRTVVIPEFLPNEETVRNIAKLLAPYDKSPHILFKIIKYRKLGVRNKYSHFTTPSQAYMEMLKELAIKNGISNVLVV